MKHVSRRAVTAAALVLATVTCAAAFDGWHQVDSSTIEGAGGGWDYVSLDSANNRLFIGHRKIGLQVFDLATKKVVKIIDKTDTASSNGALLMPEFDLGISNNEDGTITPFKLSTLEVSPAIKLGEELDTSHYDPATKRIIVNMAPAKGASSTELIVLEAPSLKQVGVIKVDTKKPEHAEADGAGKMYMAGRDTEQIYVMDTKAMTVVAQYPTPGCGQTNSVALDAANKRLMIGCRGNKTTPPSFAVMNTEDGKIVYTAEIGGGNDGMAYDPALKRIFLANGVGAVLNVFEQVDANTYKPVEALGTASGVRALAYDAKNKKIYTVAAEGTADFSKKITTSVSPFYANTFTANSFKVLTFSK